ncbi:hypothetical protein ambt_10570 [Alteromonas naphthalenivorans]|uniref:Sulfotransferase domain-containing protein n=2 Tax=Alteromonas naphthalenivorans TaxID=715451 RepID=F5ZBH9_ALTNA|nr:hypothetical protein ambt_10570 [Alteromonas naphthalenivorans]
MSMSHFQRLAYLSKNLSLLTAKPNRIYMLSHMRSRSSLLSHILGSNPNISGYSELSIKYRDRLAGLDQKIKLHQDELLVNSVVKLFDKILHNSFDFQNVSSLNTPEVDILIMLRPPESTIKSIVTMGEKNDNAKYADISWASGYYKDRVEKITRMAKELERFFFLKSDDIVNFPEETLSKLSKFMDLPIPLTSEYGSFSQTGMKKSGDTSENIKLGKIVKTVSVR